MLTRIITVVFLIICITGCSSKKAAFKYNQDIIKYEEELGPHINKTEGAIEKFIINNEFDSIVVAGKGMEEKVEGAIEKVKALKVPDAKEAGNFRTAALEYFAFIKSIYTSYKNYGAAATDEEREEAKIKILTLAGKKEEVLRAMQKVQKKFAQANGFKLK